MKEFEQLLALFVADALQAARRAVLAMRASDEIGDDAFHHIEEEPDWLEMANGLSTASDRS